MQIIEDFEIGGLDWQAYKRGMVLSEHPFYTLIMAAILAAKTPAQERIEDLWPHVRKAVSISEFVGPGTDQWAIRQAYELRNEDYYALVQAAMRNADSDNQEILNREFPILFRTLRERYNAPGGFISYEEAKRAGHDLPKALWEK